MSDLNMIFNLPFISDCLIKFALSVICGFILGMERKSRNQAVGIRTLILICISSTILSILSIYIPEHSPVQGDPTRIIAGVVSGIGFLGGGAILRQGMNIKGLTSSAIIWTTSAIGLCIGAGLYVQSIIVLLICETILIAVEKFEARLFPAVHKKTLHITFENDSVEIDSINKIIEKSGVIICDLNLNRHISDGKLSLHYSVKTPQEMNFSKMIDEMKKDAPLREFSVTE